jgi:hypothetical protein
MKEMLAVGGMCALICLSRKAEAPAGNEAVRDIFLRNFAPFGE